MERTRALREYIVKTVGMPVGLVLVLELFLAVFFEGPRPVHRWSLWVALYPTAVAVLLSLPSHFPVQYQDPAIIEKTTRWARNPGYAILCIYLLTEVLADFYRRIALRSGSLHVVNDAFVFLTADRYFMWFSALFFLCVVSGGMFLIIYSYYVPTRP